MSLGYESIRSCLDYMRSMEAKVKTLCRAQAADGDEHYISKTHEIDGGEFASIVLRMQQGKKLLEICREFHRDQRTIRKTLATKGYDIRGLVNKRLGPSCSAQPTEEIGLKFKELLEQGGHPETSHKKLGISHRVAYESLGMVGGAHIPNKDE